VKPKYYLRQVKQLDKIIDAKLEQIQNLKNMSTRVTSCLNNERTESNTIGDKVGSSVMKIIDLEIEINETIDKLVDLKREVTRKIDGLVNGDYKLLLTLRYLNFKTWEEIAVEMGFTFRWVHELHKRSLIEFEKIYSEEYSR